MHAALEAVEDAFNAVFIPIVQHRILQRQPFWLRIGDKGLPAQTLAKRGDGVCLARDVGYLVADFLDHALLTAARAPPPSHVLSGLLDLLFPSHTEQPGHPMFFVHEVNGFHKRCFVGDLSFPTPSGGRQGHQGCLRLVQTCFKSRSLWVGMQGGPPHHPSFVPYHVAARRTTGPLKLIALGRKHLVPTVIGTPYPY